MAILGEKGNFMSYYFICFCQISFARKDGGSMKKLLPILLIFWMVFPINALQQGDSVVFVVDCSGSMTGNDPNGQVKDGIVQMLTALPSQTQVGLVAYQGDLLLDIPLTSIDALSQALSANPLEYGGYSNAGLAMERAVSYLPEGEGHLVLICDGEILLPSETATSHGESQFQEALEQGYGLHTFALGQWEEDSFLLDLCQKEEGSFYQVEDNLLSLWYEFCQEEQVSPWTPSHQVETKGEEQGFSWTLPCDSLEELSLFLQSSTEILDFIPHNQEVSWETGRYFHRITFHQVEGDSFDFTLHTQGVSQLTLSYQGSLTLVPVVEYIFLEESLIQAEISFFTEEGTLLLAEPDFEQVELWVNGESFLLQEGKITVPLVENSPVELIFSFEQSPISLEAPSIWLFPQTKVWEEEQEVILWTPVFIAIATLLLAKRIIFCRKPKENKTKGKKQADTVSRKKVKKQKYNYVGRIWLELSQGREDFPQKEYALARVPNHRPISLEELLGICYEEIQLDATDKIIFSPWKDKMIQVRHESKATLLYEHTILHKNQGHCLPVGGRLEIRLEGGSELVIIYDL